MSALESAQKIKAKFGDLISEPAEFRGEITVKLADAEKIVEVCNYAKNDLDFNYLVDISSVDNYGDDPRWTVVYHLRGLRHGGELRIKTDVSEEKSELPSVLGVWRTANWHEREIYDMMGIKFTGHPDLRRILMWDGYPYFPLRKEFPLAGHETPLHDAEVAAETGAKVRPAPMAGGPFVAAQQPTRGDAEPRAKDESWHEAREKPDAPAS